MINPYTCYIAAFLSALLVYPLGWSTLYPVLSLSLLIFLVITLIIHSIFGWYWNRTQWIPFIKLEATLNPVLITVFIWILWSIEFLYEGGIPLFKILLHIPYDYRLFGVPSLHVFVVTFSSFYAVYLFHVFLSTKRPLILFLYIVNLFAALLIYNRGMLFFNLSGSFFIYLFSIEKISFQKLAITVVGVIFLFYSFGVLGNLRVSFYARQKYSQTLFLETGKASSAFRESAVPNEFFWTYIYLSSPLANLQTNINNANPPSLTVSRVFDHFNNEFLFDFISKRINRLTGTEREKENTMPGPFNVSTVYSRSYSYSGWKGVIAMAIFVLLVPLLYRKMFKPDHPYALIGMAILCTMYLFLAFDNTIRFTGLGFQLVYPLVFPLADRVFKRNE